MAGLSISPPGVEVIQEFVSTSPTAIIPFLPSVYVGPAFQVVSAFDDLGNPLVEAFAGTYRDGLGRIAFNLPNLVSEASLVGFEESVRVFLLNGSVVNELASESDEESILDNETGDYTAGTPAFLEDLSQLFTQIGVEVGDVVRFDWTDPGPSGVLGETVDIPITAVLSDTKLELDGSIVPETLPAHTYDIIRTPAQFVFDAVQQANAEIGEEADFIRFTAQLLKTDGLTPGDYLGSAGDAVSILFSDSPHTLDGADGVVGDSIFYSGTLTAPPVTPGTGDFLLDVGAQGPVTGELILIGGPLDAKVFQDVLYVVSAAQLVIETGATTGLTAQAWSVGNDSGATFLAGSGTTLTVGAAPNTLTVVGGNFETSIGAAGPAPAGTYVELSSGVYLVTTVTDDNNIIFTALSAFSDGLLTEDPVILLEVANGADGETGALTSFSTISGDLTTLADDSTEAINFGGNKAAPVTSVSDENNAIIGAFAPIVGTSGADQAYSAVLLVSPLVLTWDSAAVQVIIQLERGRDDAGVTQSSHAAITDAIDTLANPSYNATVTDVIDATLGGTVGTGLVDLGEVNAVGLILQLDGGSNEEQLLLDANLLGSGTPTAQVYVSYKALRVDLSAQSANFDGMLFIENDDQRELRLGPATTDNPLSLAVAFGLINSPTEGVFALGVSEVTAAKPAGTVASYSAALNALESEDIHLIVPLTQDLSVAQILQVHVDAMSVSTEKAERIGFFSSTLPEFDKAEVLASGTTGNSGSGSGGTPLKMTGENPAEFRTSTDLVAAGVLAGDVLVVTAFAGASSELVPVDGTVGPLYGLTVTTPPTKGGDDFVLQVDASLLTDISWDQLIDVNWTVYRAGAAISEPFAQAEVIAQTSEAFADRRLYHHWPDVVTADVDGTEFLLPGYFLASGWAGKANVTAPEKGFSAGTVAGYTGVKHSTGYFTKGHLDRVAGGGTWISHQESQNAPIKCRHQLSTDTSSVEKREFNVTRVVDYVAKYLRLGLNRQVGQFNIVQSYLDALSTSIQGLMTGLEEGGRIISGTLVSLAVNDLQPDKIDVVIAIQVPIPANYIEITLQI
jgi:hypothetical protein